MNKKINLTEVAERWLRNEGQTFNPDEVAKLSRFASLVLQRQGDIFDNVASITNLDFGDEERK